MWIILDQDCDPNNILVRPSVFLHKFSCKVVKMKCLLLIAFLQVAHTGTVNAIKSAKAENTLTRKLREELDLITRGDCGEGMFRCDQGRCIRHEYMCDGEHDCFDGSDESVDACVRRVCDKDEYFRCKDGRCVPLRWYCDGDNDCLDGSDEPSVCGQRSTLHDYHESLRKERASECSSDKIRCKNAYCIPKTYLCDGANDCPEHDDEQNCNRKERASDCSSDKIRCKNAYCIPKTYLCDGANDCPEHDDEQNCVGQRSDLHDYHKLLTAERASECSSDKIRCKNAYCIPKTYVCDGANDCPEHDDEQNCN
ncbi:very low-density lipoprotein receptor [Patella vulgata]|uniref:very low-density lipoprotein receptor n=1 Tax=Patella vulgata TaxID=6465 RepID=UPI00217FF143|nr:very low-density lipoprotein receptor [Patella vulgata]